MTRLDLSTQFDWALLLAHRAVDPPPSSSLAEEERLQLAPPPRGGARFPTLAACGAILIRSDFDNPQLDWALLLAHRAVDPPPSSSFAEEERLRSLLLRPAARDSRRSQHAERS
jgi:hypothetical protein